MKHTTERNEKKTHVEQQRAISRVGFNVGFFFFLFVLQTLLQVWQYKIQKPMAYKVIHISDPRYELLDNKAPPTIVSSNANI